MNNIITCTVHINMVGPVMQGISQEIGTFTQPLHQTCHPTLTDEHMRNTHHANHIHVPYARTICPKLAREIHHLYVIVP